MRKILIAGASGFIGRALIEHLIQNTDFQIVALSRKDQASTHPRVEWKKADLFSLQDIMLAMQGCESAYYLVHSMLPSATLSQGTFYDFDLIMADNFIRAAKFHKLEHITYLGGMIPQDEDLSWHLRSRLEVEETIMHCGIKSSALRAGMIIGTESASFVILQRLIQKLPILVSPRWMSTLSQPVALKDMIKILTKIQIDKNLQGKSYDIGGPEVISYKQLVTRTGVIINKSRKVISLNIIPMFISRWWVSFITRVPKNLVYPLLLSLKHQMVVQPARRWPHASDLSAGIESMITEALSRRPTHSFSGYIPVQKDVRSIQRLVLPKNRDADWVAREYFKWLPMFFSSLIKVSINERMCTFYLFDPKIPLLILEKSLERSTPDRQLLYIVGGLLSAEQKRGRLEFREVLDKQYVMAAIHEFRPALPWFIYRWTQALVHLFVMRGFSEHLKWHVISQKRG